MTVTRIDSAAAPLAHSMSVLHPKFNREIIHCIFTHCGAKTSAYVARVNHGFCDAVARYFGSPHFVKLTYVTAIVEEDSEERLLKFLKVQELGAHLDVALVRAPPRITKHLNMDNLTLPQAIVATKSAAAVKLFFQRIGANFSINKRFALFEISLIRGEVRICAIFTAMKGFNINQAACRNSSPLAVSISLNHIDLSKHLIEKGINFMSRDIHGTLLVDVLQTHYTRNRRDRATFELLKEELGTLNLEAGVNEGTQCFADCVIL